jgi:CubicO group peptidase (beta-lactamase class C family)
VIDSKIGLFQQNRRLADVAGALIDNAAFGPSITADSVFWIASMTKAVTATACMQLVEQGKLQLHQETPR